MLPSKGFIYLLPSPGFGSPWLSLATAFTPPRQHISRHILPSFTLSPPIHASGRPLHICPPPLPSPFPPMHSHLCTPAANERVATRGCNATARFVRAGAARRRNMVFVSVCRVYEGERRGSIVVVVFRSLKFALPRELPTPASQEQPWRFGFSSGVSW